MSVMRLRTRGTVLFDKVVVPMHQVVIGDTELVLASDYDKLRAFSNEQGHAIVYKSERIIELEKRLETLQRSYDSIGSEVRGNAAYAESLRTRVGELQQQLIRIRDIAKP